MERKPEFIIVVFDDEEKWDIGISLEKTGNPRRRGQEYMILKEHVDAALGEIQKLREEAGNGY